MNDPALQDLLLRMADDALIIAHRNSEWTGLGPLLEEDIAFSSIAQDKLGHAHALYQMLAAGGDGDPDALAFTRNTAEMRSCHLVEYPIGDYAFSLVRHFLFDTSEQLRYALLESSTYAPLAKLATKLQGEIKYHTFHANTWMVQLGAKGNEQSRDRMQAALNQAYPLALGIFEPCAGDVELAERGIFPGERELESHWQETVGGVVERAGLVLPSRESARPAYGGRIGEHTEYLQPLLEEMGEVYRIDPSAEW